METTGIIWGLYSDYRVYIRVIVGLYRDDGKENANYRDYRVYIGDIRLRNLKFSLYWD